jgi:hypothetical protein
MEDERVALGAKLLRMEGLGEKKNLLVQLVPQGLVYEVCPIFLRSQ